MAYKKIMSSPYFIVASIVATFMAGLLLQGNIPGFSLATLGQTIAVAGYPISFIDSGTLYATHIGLPSPSPMSSLLAPALLMVMANIIGIDPINSYVLSFLVFYSAGFYGAYKLSRSLNASPIDSSLLALLWMSFPIVWNSSAYSHLHFAFVLFPFLMYVSITSVLYKENWQDIGSKKKILLFLLPTLTIFTDGYAFMFYAVTASIIIAYDLYVRWRHQVKFEGRLKVISLHIFSFSFAYILYAAYIGVTSYAASPIDFHRGWGVDLLYLLIPTHGVHFFWDSLGLAQMRNAAQHFGDASVWISSFMMPMIIFAVIFFRKIDSKIKWLAITIFLVSTYLALGPSLKLNAVRDVGTSSMMKASQATFSTGSALLYENIPGFKSMRATFRWVLVAFFALWFLLLLYIVKHNSKKNKIIILFLILLFIPDIRSHIEAKINSYRSYEKIRSDLLMPLVSATAPRQKIAFLPYRNDFMVNYIAPYSEIYTYNIGGDKNLELAKLNWPDELGNFVMGRFHPTFSEDILLLLLSDKDVVDAVVIPHVDMLWAAHQWPSETINDVERNFVVNKLTGFGVVDVEIFEFFTIVKLRNDLTPEQKNNVLASLEKEYCIRNCYDNNNFAHFALSHNGVLSDGMLVSDGKKGFLHFGPYLNFRAGLYVLTIEVLNCNLVSDDAFVDVVSEKGQRLHFKKNLRHTKSCSFTTEIELNNDHDDLEVRVFTGDGDFMILKSIQLKLKSIP